MHAFEIIAILVSLTAAFSFINHKYVGLHPTVGVMLIAVIFSLVLIAAGHFGLHVREAAIGIVDKIPFDAVLLRWMLGFLLFAGAMSVDLGELSRHRAVTASLALVATISSTFIVGGLFWIIFKILHLGPGWLDCLLLGALISPTDPVAVLALVRRVGAPESVETIIAGESLFNDGIGVVLFLTILKLSQHDGMASAGGAVVLFAREAAGGAILGLVCGWIIYQMLKRVQEFQLEVLLTLCLTMGSYALADAMNVSGPIAVVVAGLLIGNHGRILAMPEATVSDLRKFWELVDQLLNACLFVLIGLEFLAIPFEWKYLVAAAVGIPIVLAGRWASVVGTLWLPPHRKYANGAMVRILTWGGLRGGLAIAMALVIPPSSARPIILTITYCIVVFSILVQGTTLRRMVMHAMVQQIDGPPIG